MNKSLRIIQIITAAVVIFLFIAHLFKWQVVRVDWIAIALLGALLLIIFLELVKKIKLFDFEAEIGTKEIQRVQKEASDFVSEQPNEFSELNDYSSITDLVTKDKLLAFAKLRLELEQLLKSIYEVTMPDSVVKKKMGLSLIARKLGENNKIPEDIIDALVEVIRLSNRVIHGEYVKQEDAEKLAEIGVNLLQQLKLIQLDQFVKEVESHEIGKEELHKYGELFYMVKTVIPYADKPILNTRIMNQEGLDFFFQGYDEFAEFIVEIQPVVKTNKRSK